jgi:hypothetical protein
MFEIIVTQTIEVDLTTKFVYNLASLITNKRRCPFVARILTSWTPSSKTPKVEGYVICGAYEHRNEK